MSGRKVRPFDPRTTLRMSPRFVYALDHNGTWPDDLTDDEVRDANERYKRQAVARLLGREVTP